MHRATKIVVILAAVYVLLVMTFESLLGIYQPTYDGTMVITTTDATGERADRVLAKMEVDGAIYAAANHWPRAWYHQALDNPEVSLTLEDGPADYLAVQLSDAEAAKVDAAYSLPLFFRVLTGFPPRYILRLDPN